MSNTQNKISSNIKSRRMSKFNDKYGIAPEWTKNFFKGKDKPQQRCYKEFEEEKFQFWLSYERPYLTKDNTVKTTNSYFAYPTVDNFLNKYNTLNVLQKTFYEQIRGECCEFYDIDGGCSTLNTAGKYYSENSDNDIITDFINARIAWGKLTNGKYKKKTINRDTDVYVLTSCSAEKKSFHISIRTGDLFKDIKDLGKYTNEFAAYIAEQRYPFSFDRGVYTKNRNFRIIGSHKVKSKRTLVRSDWNSLSQSCDDKFFFNSWVEPEIKENFDSYGEVVYTMVAEKLKEKVSGPVIIRDSLGEDKLSLLVGYIVEMVKDMSHSLCDDSNPSMLGYKQWFPLAMSVVRETLGMEIDKAVNIFSHIYDLYKNPKNVRPTAEEEYTVLSNYVNEKYTSNSLHKWASENPKYEIAFEEEQKKITYDFYKWKQDKLDEEIEGGLYTCISDIPSITNKCISRVVVENFLKETVYVVEGGGDATLVTKDREWDTVTKKWVDKFNIQLKIGKLLPASAGTLTTLTRAVKWVNPLYLTKPDEDDEKKEKRKKGRSPSMKKKKKKKKDDDEEEPLFIFHSFGDIARDLYFSGQLKSYKDYIFRPYYDKPPKHTLKNFNLFTPFEFSNDNDRLCDEEEIQAEVIDVFENSLMYRHITEILCDGEKEISKYLLDWISHMIQHPEEVAEVQIIIHGDQGNGKDLFGEFIAFLIGTKYKSVYGSLDDYCRNFNAEQAGKLLVVLNELDGQSSTNSKSAKNNQMKNKITDPKMRLEKKGIDAIFIETFIRHLGLTNNLDCVYLEETDRRYCLIKANNKFAQNPNYFGPLWIEIKDIDFLKTAFAYFANRDITDYKPRNPPMTKYKKEQNERCLNSSIEFMKFIFTDLESMEDEELPRLMKLRRESKEEKGEQDSDFVDSDSEVEGDEVELEKFKKVDFHCHTDALYSGYQQWCKDDGNRSVRRKTFVSHLDRWGIKELKRIRIKKEVIDCPLISAFYNKYELTIGKQKNGFRINKYKLVNIFKKQLRDKDYMF